jgi:hypothetical protein
LSASIIDGTAQNGVAKRGAATPSATEAKVVEGIRGAQIWRKYEGLDYKGDNFETGA